MVAQTQKLIIMLNIHFTRLGANSSEWMKIKAFSVSPNPEYNNANWIIVDKVFLCPLTFLHNCVAE